MGYSISCGLPLMNDRTSFSFSTGLTFSGRNTGLGGSLSEGHLYISNQSFALRNCFDMERAGPTTTRGELASIEKPGFQHQLMDSRPPSMIWKDTVAMEF